MKEWYTLEPDFLRFGTRPGALWRAVSPGALKLMIEDGADVNARDAAGRTAMHHIAFHCSGFDIYYDSGSREQRLIDSGHSIYFNPNAMIQTLIDSGADVNARGNDGVTPLMFAAMNAKLCSKALETMKLLIRNGADAEAEDGDRFYRFCVLDWMDGYWGSNTLDELIMNEIFWEIYLSAQPERAKAGAYEEAAEAVKEAGEGGEGITKYPAPLPAADIDLMTAAFWGSADDLAPILARGANIEARTKRGLTPLMFSSVWRNAPASKFLIERGAALDAKTYRGDTALTLAMLDNDFSMTETLLKAGSNMRETDVYGRTPLMILVSELSWENIDDLVKDFINAGADVNAKDNHGLTVLMHAVEYNARTGMARSLIDAGADVNARDKDGLTALMYLAKNSKPDTGETGTLIDAGADVNAKDKDGLTALMHLAMKNEPNVGTAEILLNAGADVNASDNQGRTALEIALDKSREDEKPGGFVKYLLSNGADPRLMPIERPKQDGKDERRAVEGLSKFTLKHVCSFLDVSDCILNKSPYSIMKTLIRAGAHLNHKRRIQMRNDIAQDDCYHDLRPTLRLKILDSLLNVYNADHLDADLFAAVVWGDTADIESALSAGADVNAAADKGYTPLMFASVFNNVKAVEYLISKGANVDAENDQQETAIELAVKAGSAMPVKALAMAGANVNARGQNGSSLLLLAYSEEAAAALIKAGANLEAKNESGETPLKEAMRLSRFKIARVLLAAGADPQCILDDESECAAGNKPERKNKRCEDKKESISSDSDVLRQFGLEV